LKILIFTPAPANISPSQRFRIEHYIKLGKEKGVDFTVKPFYSNKTWSVLHLKNHLFQKVGGIFWGFVKRFFSLFTLFNYDFVYIHREAAPVGPPVIEWLIAKVFRKKIVYDFDDNIWTSLASEANPGVARIKCAWKCANICKMSYLVSVGNDFLAKYALQYNKNVHVIPTVVNTENYHNKLKNQDEGKITIGWTGTYTNLHNLSKISGVIKKLKEKYDFNFHIIANKDPMLEGVEYIYKKWNLQSEISDLLEMHIGIMPLANTDIELGKCGFKAIQYASLGIPAVVSPVGANKNVITDGIEGYWADSEEEWYNKLEKLICDKELRKQMGQNGRNKMLSKYSVETYKDVFFGFFTSN
jgi:glycosyltransferase involved in cell wall biosynthesis